MANGKLPSVEYDVVSGGLTGACAHKWAVFLAENYLFDNDDPLLYDRFKSIAESLEATPKPVSVHCRGLEKEIQKWTTSQQSSS